MPIFHLALASDWEAAQQAGRYTTSTLGRTLAEEGFIHASRGDQWQGVRARFYREVTEPLVLLVIDPALLSAPVVDEAVPGTHETFPHVYGALDLEAVVRVVPLDADHRAATESPVPTAPAAPAAPAAPTAPSAPAGQPGPPAPQPSYESFSRVYFRELFHYVALVSVVMAVVVVAVLLGIATGHDWGPLLGALVGLAAGVLAARVLHRRREGQLDAAGRGAP